MDTPARLSVAIRNNSLLELEQLLKIEGNSNLEFGYEFNIQAVYSSASITPLILASAHGTPDSIRMLLENGANLFYHTNNGSTVLHFSTRFGRLENLDVLLCKGAYTFLNDRMTDGITALHEASRCGHADICARFLSRQSITPVKMGLEDSQSLTPLMHGAVAGHVEVVRCLLQHRALINHHSGKKNYTALHHAIVANHEEVVNVLLDNAADVNRQGGEWGTAVHLAAHLGRDGFVKALVSKKDTQINGRNKYGNTPLHLATLAGYLRTVRTLCDMGADTSVLNNIRDSSLHQASRLGNVDIVELLVRHGSDLEAQNELGDTPLQVACLSGRTAIVVKLLEYNAKIRVQNHRQRTPLHNASWKRHWDIVQILIDKGADPHTLNDEGFSSFHLLCNWGAPLRIPQQLFAQGCSIEKANAQNETPLFLACFSGQVEIVKWLLSQGAQIEDKTTERKMTPLHVAARKGWDRVAIALLHGGASVDAINDGGNTPLQLACSDGQTKVAEVLLEHGADLESTNNTGNTSLQLAAFFGHDETTRFLLHKGADVDSRSSGGNTPLQLASGRDHVEVVKTLLQHGAAVDSANKGGDTSLILACDKGYIAPTKALLKVGANLEASANSGNTALHFAAICGNTAVVEALLKKGAKAGTANNIGNTPLHLAVSNYHDEIVKTLLRGGADIDRPNSSGNVPLHDACCVDNVCTLQILLRHGADRSKTDTNGWSALHFACASGNIKVVKALVIDNRIDPTIRDSQGKTALSRAAINKHVDIVLHLLQSNWYYPDDPARSKGYVIKEQERSTISKVLFQALTGPTTSTSAQLQNSITYWAIANHDVGLLEMCTNTKPGFCFRNKMTWLHVAAQFGHVDLLGRFFPGKDLLSDYDMTALHLAAANGHHETVDALLWKVPRETKLNQRGRVDALNLKNTDGHSPLALAANGRHRGVMRLIWAELTQFAKSNPQHIFLEPDHSSDLIELAARYETPGQEYTLRRLLSIWFSATIPGHEVLARWTELHLAVHCAQPIAVWWLLSNGGHLNSQEIKKARQIAECNNQHSNQINLVRIKDLLHNLPPVIEHLAVVEKSFVPIPPTLSEKRQYVSALPVMISGFYVKEERVNLHLIASDIQNAIYEKGPQEVMDEAQESNCRELHLLKQMLADDQHDAVIRERSEDHQRDVTRTDINEAQAGSTKYSKSQTETFNKTRNKTFGASGNLQLRWLHCPVNNILFLNDLVTRLSVDSGRTQKMHRTLLNFFKRTWTELAAGSGEYYMKPQCLQEATVYYDDYPPDNQGRNKKQELHTTHFTETEDIPPKAGTLQTHRVARFPDRQEGRLALYIPYLISKAHTKPDKTSNNNAVQTQRHDRINTQQSTSQIPLQQRPDYLKSQAGSRETAMVLNDLNPKSKETWHSPLTLDQYYYATLKDGEIHDRDNDQVLSKYLEQFEKDNGEGKTTRIFAVDQLWLWIVDDKTIITSTTRPSQEIDDTVFSRIQDLLTFNESDGLAERPRSVSALMKLILGATAGLFIEKNIPVQNDGETEFKSPLQIFRESIRRVAKEESDLFGRFLEDLEKEKEERASLDNEAHLRLIRKTPRNRYHIIDDEARWLNEIKDIRDELNMLRTLAEAQERVWKQAFRNDGLDTYGFDNSIPCNPSQVVREIQEMGLEAETVQNSINTLLELRQKQASIKEAEYGRLQANDSARQANTVLVFTLVTIIFLPLSFLTSLFALNVVEFPHQSNDVAYEARWIMPIIFGTSAAVSIPCIWIAFNLDKTVDLWYHVRSKSKVQHPPPPSAGSEKASIHSAREEHRPSQDTAHGAEREFLDSVHRAEQAFLASVQEAVASRPSGVEGGIYLPYQHHQPRRSWLRGVRHTAGSGKR